MLPSSLTGAVASRTSAPSPSMFPTALTRFLCFIFLRAERLKTLNATHFTSREKSWTLCKRLKLARKLNPSLHCSGHGPPHQTGDTPSGPRLDRMPSKDAAKALAAEEDNIVHHLSLHACSTLRRMSLVSFLARARGNNPMTSDGSRARTTLTLRPQQQPAVFPESQSLLHAPWIQHILCRPSRT